MVFFLFTTSSTLEASYSGQGYPLEITSVRASVLEPDRNSDYFRTIITCKLDNGLEAIWLKKYLYKSQAVDEARYQKGRLFGTVFVKKQYKPNSPYNFSIQLEGESYKEDALLSQDDDQPLELLETPTVTSVTENVTHYFFSSEYKYVLTFSDNSTWEVGPRGSPWNTPWEIGEQVLFVDGSTKPCLINIDRFLKDKVYFVKDEHCLDYYFRTYECIK